MFRADNKTPTDLELMNLAKKRIMLRDNFKWHCKIFATVSIVLFFLWFTLSNPLWPILVILIWGIAVAIYGLIVRIEIAGSCQTVSEEYYRLRKIAGMTETKNGGIYYENQENI